MMCTTCAQHPCWDNSCVFCKSPNIKSPEPTAEIHRPRSSHRIVCALIASPDLLPTCAATDTRENGRYLWQEVCVLGASMSHAQLVDVERAASNPATLKFCNSTKTAPYLHRDHGEVAVEEVPDTCKAGKGAGGDKTRQHLDRQWGSGVWDLGCAVWCRTLDRLYCLASAVTNLNDKAPRATVQDSILGRHKVHAEHRSPAPVWCNGQRVMLIQQGQQSTVAVL